MDELDRGAEADSEERGSRAARIKDVARLAKVSTATVSRALAYPERVSPEARARVIEAIAKIGYVPNPAARSLRSQKTRMVLVVLPNLDNIFFSRILRGIEEALFEAGYGMIIGDLDGALRKGGALRRLRVGRPGGRRASPQRASLRPVAGRQRPAMKTTVPLVALCEAIPGADIPADRGGQPRRRAADDAISRFRSATAASPMCAAPPTTCSSASGSAAIATDCARRGSPSIPISCCRATTRSRRARRPAGSSPVPAPADRRVLLQRRDGDGPNAHAHLGGRAGAARRLGGGIRRHRIRRHGAAAAHHRPATPARAWPRGSARAHRPAAGAAAPRRVRLKTELVVRGSTAPAPASAKKPAEGPA